MILRFSFNRFSNVCWLKQKTAHLRNYFGDLFFVFNKKINQYKKDIPNIKPKQTNRTNTTQTNCTKVIDKLKITCKDAS